MDIAGVNASSNKPMHLSVSVAAENIVVLAHTEQTWTPVLILEALQMIEGIVVC